MKASSLRDFYLLVKPGIIRGNLLTAIGGFFLAAQGSIDWLKLAALLVGTSLVIGGACVFNNIYDRRIDAHMLRTKSRALVSGAISIRSAAIFGASLTIIGTLSLICLVNLLTALIGLIGFLTYVALYTPAKHRTPYATLLGTIPGAVPPVAGYTAVTGHLDMACLLLFLILVCWQMPHFYAIAIRRLDEYKAAKIPVWPAVYGVRSTQVQMAWFIAAFIVFVVRLSLSGYASWLFAFILGGYGVIWLVSCLQGFHAPDKQHWALRVFLFSLPVLPLFSMLFILDHWIN